MASNPLVFVIVLNYNSFLDTQQCIDCVRQSNYKNYKLLVIDNASPDHSGEKLSQLLPPHEFLGLAVNTGYAGGNNMGISLALKAEADYVLILNPDVRIPADGISEYIQIMEDDTNIGILSPLQLTGPNGVIDTKFEESILRRHGLNLSSLSNKHRVLNVSHVLGAIMMVRVDAFKAAGGFDPLFFAYGEEEDFCRRVLNRGFKISITTVAPAVHLRTNEKNTVSDQILFLRTKGHYLLSLKNPQYSFPTLAISILTSAFTDLVLMSKKRYPFRYYPVTRWHVLRAICWLFFHLPMVFLHRQKDSLQAPYLPANTGQAF
jgi:GT2 family glycosyltransferase